MRSALREISLRPAAALTCCCYRRIIPGGLIKTSGTRATCGGGHFSRSCRSADVHSPAPLKYGRYYSDS